MSFGNISISAYSHLGNICILVKRSFREKLAFLNYWHFGIPGILEFLAFWNSCHFGIPGYLALYNLGNIGIF